MSTQSRGRPPDSEHPPAEPTPETDDSTESVRRALLASRTQSCEADGQVEQSSTCASCVKLPSKETLSMFTEAVVFLGVSLVCLWVAATHSEHGMDPLNSALWAIGISAALISLACFMAYIRDSVLGHWVHVSLGNDDETLHVHKKELNPNFYETNISPNPVIYLRLWGWKIFRKAYMVRGGGCARRWNVSVEKVTSATWISVTDMYGNVLNFFISNVADLDMLTYEVKGISSLITLHGSVRDYLSHRDAISSCLLKGHMVIIETALSQPGNSKAATELREIAMNSLRNVTTLAGDTTEVESTFAKLESKIAERKTGRKRKETGSTRTPDSERTAV